MDFQTICHKTEDILGVTRGTAFDVNSEAYKVANEISDTMLRTSNVTKWLSAKSLEVYNQF